MGFIDEIDLHLHPQWEAEIAPKLQHTFPNVQFVVSTHSPHVVNRVASEQIRIIDRVDGEVVVRESSLGYGLESNLVLQTFMGVVQVRPLEIEGLLDQLFEAIQDGAITGSTSILNELMQLVPDEPQLSRARILIDRLIRRNGGV